MESIIKKGTIVYTKFPMAFNYAFDGETQLHNNIGVNTYN